MLDSRHFFFLMQIISKVCNNLNYGLSLNVLTAKVPHLV